MPTNVKPKPGRMNVCSCKRVPIPVGGSNAQENIWTWHPAEEGSRRPMRMQIILALTNLVSRCMGSQWRRFLWWGGGSRGVSAGWEERRLGEGKGGEGCSTHSMGPSFTPSLAKLCSAAKWKDGCRPLRGFCALLDRVRRVRGPQWGPNGPRREGKAARGLCGWCGAAAECVDAQRWSEWTDMSSSARSGRDPARGHPLCKWRLQASPSSATSFIASFLVYPKSTTQQSPSKKRVTWRSGPCGGGTWSCFQCAHCKHLRNALVN